MCMSPGGDNDGPESLIQATTMDRNSESSVRWDPYEVWKALVLNDPLILLRPNDAKARLDGDGVEEFATSIADLPDDLQDALFVLAQMRGVDEACSSLDRAIRDYFNRNRRSATN